MPGLFPYKNVVRCAWAIKEHEVRNWLEIWLLMQGECLGREWIEWKFHEVMRVPCRFQGN